MLTTPRQTEKQTQSFKNFRNRIETQASIERMAKSRAERNKNAAVQDEWDEHDFTALLEFRDIEDELGTLAKLFHKQIEVVEEMIKHYETDSLGYETLESVLATLDGYNSQHHEMVERASAGHESVRSPLLVSYQLC
jgi:hypothetical protein